MKATNRSLNPTLLRSFWCLGATWKLYNGQQAESRFCLIA